MTDANLVLNRLSADSPLAGLVTDGVVRDAAGVLSTGLPVWCQGVAAPPSVAGLTFVAWQQPVACGGVAVFPGDTIVVACGAVNSAVLLLKSATDRHPTGLANSSGLVGARYMAHLATMMQGFHPLRVNHDVFQKTVAINDFYLKGRDVDFPLGQIQSQGHIHPIMIQTAAPPGRRAKRCLWPSIRMRASARSRARRVRSIRSWIVQRFLPLWPVLISSPSSTPRVSRT